MLLLDSSFIIYQRLCDFALSILHQKEIILFVTYLLTDALKNNIRSFFSKRVGAVAYERLRYSALIGNINLSILERYETGLHCVKFCVNNVLLSVNSKMFSNKAIVYIDLS